MELDKSRMPTAKEQKEKTWQQIEGPIFKKFIEVALQKIDKAVEKGCTYARVECSDFGFCGNYEMLPKKYREEFEKYGYQVEIPSNFIIIRW